MRTRLAIKLHAVLERHFPERRIFLRSDSDTRFIRLKPGTQILAFSGSALILAWTIVATAILLMDSIGGGTFRDQALRDQETYMQRLNALSEERDAYAADALAAQERFNSALASISVMQEQLLASEIRRREMEQGLETVQVTLRDVMSRKKEIGAELAALRSAVQNGSGLPGDAESQTAEAVTLLVAALERTATERDTVIADAEATLLEAERMAQRIRAMEARNDRIFRQLEEAMTISVEPLDRMFAAAGMDTDRMLEQVRRGYSGQGGPLTPISLSTRGADPELFSPDAARANGILQEMDRLNLYRLAAAKAPFALPIKDRFRYTSGFGMRWGRMHAGTDFAAPHGTDIHATADGVVIHAGWLSGYGKLIKIRHEFGIETRYAHLSNIRVKKGDRVSRGQHIGDMGNTGRSTGTHLHYEVRVNGKAVNPMTYIKAANDVF